MKAGNKKRIYSKGSILGNHGVIFVKEVASKEQKNGKETRRALFQCHCGKEFITNINQVIRGGTKSCGCKTTEYIRMAVTKHGLYQHPLYKIWMEIKERVLNNKNKGYKNYGGRGITMFPPWINDFPLFLDYVSALPCFLEKKYTLDRINNDGNYEPGNLRWTTRHIQSVNKRPRKPSSSGYTDVYKVSPRGNKWYVSVSVNGQKHILRGFLTPEQAVIARNKFIEENHLFEYKKSQI